MAFALLPLFVVTFIQFGHSRMPVPNEFELNPPKIELLLRRTALMALLRAKANAMLETVPLVDKVLFRQCVIESNALSPVKLAKCLAKLIQLRDQLQRQNEWEENAAPEGKEGRNDFFQSSLITKRKLARIRHFFALWRRWKGRRLAELKMKNRRITLGLGGATDKRKPDEVEAVRHKAVRRDTVRRNTATLLLNDDNLRNLQELERYTRVFDKARRSIAQINAHNTELISRFDPSARVRSAMPDGPPALLDLQHQIERFFNSLGIDKISLLSPRFFSLFPSSQRRRPNLLSPDLFSFHNNSASPLSIPSLLSSVHLSERESAAWLELLMNITGSARM
uniref:Uncharacterized protein n=1 Tax=Globodera rostochiensis TaxID=31243 RepID=A0A914HF55_GLORO